MIRRPVIFDGLQKSRDKWIGFGKYDLFLKKTVLRICEITNFRCKSDNPPL